MKVRLDLIERYFRKKQTKPKLFHDHFGNKLLVGDEIILVRKTNGPKNEYISVNYGTIGVVSVLNDSDIICRLMTNKGNIVAYNLFNASAMILKYEAYRKYLITNKIKELMKI